MMQEFCQWNAGVGVQDGVTRKTCIICNARETDSCEWPNVCVVGVELKSEGLNVWRHDNSATCRLEKAVALLHQKEGVLDVFNNMLTIDRRKRAVLEGQ